MKEQREKEFRIKKAEEAVDALRFELTNLEKKYLHTEGMKFTEIYWLKKDHAVITKALRRAIKTLNRLTKEAQQTELKFGE